MANKYQKGSHFSERKYREILKLFSADISATAVSNIVGISRPAVNRIFRNIRIKIAEHCEKSSIFEAGQIELDESYFGAKKVNSKKLLYISIIAYNRANGK